MLFINTIVSKFLSHSPLNEWEAALLVSYQGPEEESRRAPWPPVSFPHAYWADVRNATVQIRRDTAPVLTLPLQQVEVWPLRPNQWTKRLLDPWWGKNLPLLARRQKGQRVVIIIIITYVHRNNNVSLWKSKNLGWEPEIIGRTWPVFFQEEKVHLKYCQLCKVFI